MSGNRQPQRANPTEATFGLPIWVGVVMAALLPLAYVIAWLFR